MTSRCTKKRIFKYLNWSGRLQSPYKLTMKLSYKKTDQSVLKKVLNLLRNLQIRRSLTDLDQNYIVVTIYKTNGNIADNCKRFYALTLLKESGFTKGKTIAAKVIK